MSHRESITNISIITTLLILVGGTLYGLAGPFVRESAATAQQENVRIRLDNVGASVEGAIKQFDLAMAPVKADVKKNAKDIEALQKDEKKNIRMEGKIDNAVSTVERLEKSIQYLIQQKKGGG